MQCAMSEKIANVSSGCSVVPQITRNPPHTVVHTHPAFISPPSISLKCNIIPKFLFLICGSINLNGKLHLFFDT